MMKVSRNRRGHFSSELPGVLFVLFFLFVFPLMNLGTMALRYGLLATACRDGAHAAATSYTFETGSSGKPSAVSSAPSAITKFTSRYTGITVSNIDVDIVITDMNTQAISRSEGKLSAPANTQQNLYALETTLTGQLQPLITYKAPLILNVPGLTGPMDVRVTAREFAESPQGLNQ